MQAIASAAHVESVSESHVTEKSRQALLDAFAATAGATIVIATWYTLHLFI